MTMTPEDARYWVDDGTETYQPRAEYAVAKTIEANPQIEQNQLYLLLSTIMPKSRFDRAIAVLRQVKTNGTKLLAVRQHSKEQRYYYSINTDIAYMLENWYTGHPQFDPPQYVRRR